MFSRFSAEREHKIVREKGAREQILAARATPLDPLVPWPHVGEG